MNPTIVQFVGRRSCDKPEHSRRCAKLHHRWMAPSAGCAIRANCQTVSVKPWPLSQIGTIGRVCYACLSWSTRKRDTWSEKSDLLTQINTRFERRSLYVGSRLVRCMVPRLRHAFCFPIVERKFTNGLFLKIAAIAASLFEIWSPGRMDTRLFPSETPSSCIDGRLSYDRPF